MPPKPLLPKNIVNACLNPLPDAKTKGVLRSWLGQQGGNNKAAKLRCRAEFKGTVQQLLQQYINRKAYEEETGWPKHQDVTARSLFNRFGGTALHFACLGGRTAAVSLLLNQKETPLDAKNPHGYSAWHAACFSGCEAIIRALVKKGVSLGVKANNGETALFAAALGGQHQLVNELCEHTGVNHQRKDGDTALHVAARFGQLEVVKALMDHKDIRAYTTNHNGMTAYDVARAHKQDDIAGHIEKKAPHDQDPRFLALIELCLSASEHEFLEFIDEHSRLDRAITCQPNNPDLKEILEAHIGMKGNYPSSITPEVLLGRGGQTLLYWAVLGGSTRIVLQLITSTPKLLRVYTQEGQSVLHASSITNQRTIAMLLLDKDSGLIDHKDRNGKTATMLAEQYHHGLLKKILALHQSTTDNSRYLPHWVSAESPDHDAAIQQFTAVSTALINLGTTFDPIKAWLGAQDDEVKNYYYTVLGLLHSIPALGGVSLKLLKHNCQSYTGMVAGAITSTVVGTVAGSGAGYLAAAAIEYLDYHYEAKKIARLARLGCDPEEKARIAKVLAISLTFKRVKTGVTPKTIGEAMRQLLVRNIELPSLASADVREILDTVMDGLLETKNVPWDKTDQIIDTVLESVETPRIKLEELVRIEAEELAQTTLNDHIQRNIRSLTALSADNPSKSDSEIISAPVKSIERIETEAKGWLEKFPEYSGNEDLDTQDWRANVDNAKEFIENAIDDLTGNDPEDRRAAAVAALARLKATISAVDYLIKLKNSQNSRATAIGANCSSFWQNMEYGLDQVLCFDSATIPPEGNQHNSRP